MKLLLALALAAVLAPHYRTVLKVKHLRATEGVCSACHW